MTDGVAASFEIGAQNLKALRTSKGWSRNQLADRSGVSERQLARIESTGGAVRMTTRKKIAEALGVDREKLSGANSVPRNPEKLEDVGLRVRVSPQLQLAYDLVSFRYGPTRREIVELAPLLFVLLAEGSLAWRLERAEKVDALIGRLQDLGKHTALYCASFLRRLDAEADCLGSVRQAVHRHAPSFPYCLVDRGNGGGAVRSIGVVGAEARG